MSDRTARQGFWTTLRNALVLNASLYENALNTPQTHRLALTIVLLATLSHLLGSAVILLLNRASIPIFVLALFLDGLSTIAGYYLWTLIILKIGRWLKPIEPTYGDLLSPVGFAYAPQLFNFLTLIPLLGRPIELILAVWSLLAVIVATREGLDISTRQATLICLIGWIPIQMAIGFVQIFTQELLKWTTSLPA